MLAQCCHYSHNEGEDIYMSISLYFILKCKNQYEYPLDIENKISEECFKIVIEACKRGLAINEIYYRPYLGGAEFLTPIKNALKTLEKNEVLLKISNSYVFGEAETILYDDYSVQYPPHIERLKNLQGLINFIFDSPIFDDIRVYMCDDIYSEDEFETVKCLVSEFAIVMKEKLFQKLSFAYKCVIKKL